MPLGWPRGKLHQQLQTLQTINMTYQDAYNELQEIVSEIEAGEIGIDEISQKVKRASELIEVCKAKLFQTEQDVDQILKNLEQPED